MLAARGERGTTDDDDWAGNAIAFAIRDLLQEGATTAAAALVSYVDNDEERADLAEQFRSALST